LLLLALTIRVGIVVVATEVGPSDSVNDVAYHSVLVRDPVEHLRDSKPRVSQYAPYLGFVEWVTTEPWLASGASETTALRLSSVIWDLVGMGLLLYATGRRFPASLVYVGLMWAASPLLWPASAFSAQDETIGAAIVAAAVLLVFARRRCAAIAVCVLGLFVAKILLVPVVAALLLTAPRGTRVRAWATAGVTLLAAGCVTWSLSGTDGLTQQVGYTTDVVAYSISFWSALVLHRTVAADTAISASIALVCVGLLGTVLVWSRHRSQGVLEAPRLAAALLFVTFALLAVSNPEYLCIAAPVAIVGCIGYERSFQTSLLVLVSTLAWAINGVYYFFRRAYDPSGTLLQYSGIRHELSGRVRLLDGAHQLLLVLFLFFTVLLVRNYLLRLREPVTDEETDLELQRL
jgi:type IV secretory pathway VirB3-like protein